MLSEIQETIVKSFQVLQTTQLVKDKYENILEHLDSGIILFDRNGMLTFINVQMARLLGVSRSSIRGCSLTQIIRHSQMGRFNKRKILRIYKETIIYKKRYHELSDENGRYWLLTVTYGDQMDGDYLISAKDVSDHKQIEQTAYQNDKLAMLGKISASIAHEIRNPLTAIRGFIQLLRPHLLQLGKDEYARIILMEIDRANDIICEFLNSSKPSAPQTITVPVLPLLKEVVLLTESEALLKGCEIVLHEGQSALNISVDVKQIKQVILNIIKNALDAISDLGHYHIGIINLEVKEDLDNAYIHISDNGKGMDHNTLARLFDPFFTTKLSGTGLGLSVSYRIIKNHGGFISVNSTAGEGTEFIISLPKV
ncbi:PAS domain S-box-containing protein [Paenibacillus sp. DS2015]|uniref:ATP-binding protein n=1 Tax=Paenibacillus sp. DS2015 TaxID=3373917 RepID=UPI003D1E16EF